MLTTISELRKKNFPKYDVLLKRSFWAPENGLKRLLQIPDGRQLPEQLGGLAMLEVDSLTEHDGILYHVEFQTRNQSEMPWRMLVYYTTIVEEYLARSLYRGERIVQTVVYIGKAPLSMPSFIRQDHLNFEFRLHDIRNFETESGVLLKSENPYDWIVGVLCKKTIDLEEWRRVARRMTNISHRDEWCWREIPAMFLIASLLRRLPHDVFEEFEIMLEVNVRNSKIFREMYDQGCDAGLAIAYRKSIEIMLARENVPVDDAVRQRLADLDERQLSDLMERLVPGVDIHSEIMSTASPSANPN